MEFFPSPFCLTQTNIILNFSELLFNYFFSDTLCATHSKLLTIRLVLSTKSCTKMLFFYKTSCTRMLLLYKIYSTRIWLLHKCPAPKFYCSTKHNVPECCCCTKHRVPECYCCTKRLVAECYCSTEHPVPLSIQSSHSALLFAVLRRILKSFLMNVLWIRSTTFHSSSMDHDL